ncbi:MAG: OmpA family protein [Proteobacteria bacterium]|jgi:outer membrane protein OmpA-like peptidoglycan-associated protein|nr:OmpA family protein [Desulfocapsa sp.]MBU3944728.1 OmpA family protein [Pseudomonadota bacterium]MCG2742681.1 OmpA family protein [Desulfobacteraceae bacterium]MDO8948112.1 OmpA family protein [Desulfocapsaceae bacterium]MBU4030360.1 OmpA family protein [Pseudomonadota bacterium]
MQNRIFAILLLILFLVPLQSSLAATDPTDSTGSKDPDLFSRMPGFHIYRSEENEFNKYEFQIAPDKKQKVEGYYYIAVYYANEGITQPSGLQITRNYVNAAKAIGGEEVYAFEDGGTEYSIIRVIKDDKEVWAEVSGANNGMYEIHMIEKQLMKQDVVANADALANSISETGRVAVYGIYFDTDKADLKPASEPAMAEIVKMLNADGNLKVYVVGHTDNVGQFAHNIKLSQDRAGSVVNALVTRHGITASRLTPFGAGPTIPVASNKNEEGQIKNRRVELVAQ